MRRFTLAPDAIDSGRVAFGAAESRHLARVLRLRAGDTVVVSDGAGRAFTVRLERVGARSRGTIVGEAPRVAESPLAVTIIQGVPKADKMDTIVRVATELGCARVLPALAERTVVRMDAAGWRERARRWQRVAREAATQSRRAVVPDIDTPRPLVDTLGAAATVDLALCAWEGGGEPLARTLDAARAPRTAALLVGPEGGLAGHEVQAARAAGWRVVSLGPRVLRTETAAPALLAILQARFGDLR